MNVCEKFPSCAVLNPVFVRRSSVGSEKALFAGLMALCFPFAGNVGASHWNLPSESWHCRI